MNKIKKIHIIGIGGCAASAIAEYLLKQNLIVSGSEQKQRNDLGYLEKLGAKIFYSHQETNINQTDKPDLILYSPAVKALDPHNPELTTAGRLCIKLLSWQEFIGDYLNSLGKIGITASGSEGKGTTAGILTKILSGTEFDPLAILGAKLKNANNSQDSNIYLGRGACYILEADEFNRNFFNYHPRINIMINFSYEHPETYKNFEQYQEAFYQYFNKMPANPVLILRAQPSIINFVEKYNLNKTHEIIWFEKADCSQLPALVNKAIIKEIILKTDGVAFSLDYAGRDLSFKIPALPEYLVYNGTGAILAALKLGLTPKEIKNNLLNFNGMVRRFDVLTTKANGAIITDYGHSPEAITQIIKEIKTIYPAKKLHMIFQPHMFSRTYNFFNEYVKALQRADRVSLIDIYPAREKIEDWEAKVSSKMLAEKLNKTHTDCLYLGESSAIAENLTERLNPEEVTCFIGAGDMDLYYQPLINKFV